MKSYNQNSTNHFFLG